MKTRFIRLFVLGSLSLAAAAAQAGEIAVIVKTVNSTYWQNVNKGASGGIKDVKRHTMSFNGPAAETEVSAQVKMVEAAVKRNVVGIVLAASDPDALVPALKMASDAKIPVVLIDSAVSDAGKPYYQSFLATDNKAAGEACAKALIAKIGIEGKVAIMSYVAGVSSEVGRVGGFKSYLEKNSRIKVIGPFYSDSKIATAQKQTSDVLASAPDLKGIFGANEPTAVGMARALAQSGKAGKVVAIGFDGNDELQKFVRDGTLEATGVQGSYQMGYLGVRAIADLIRGKQIDKFIDTSVVLVNKTNIDKPEAKNVLY